MKVGVSRALRSESNRSTIVIGNCTERTDIGGTSPSESHRFYTSVDPVSTPQPANDRDLVESPGTAPGSGPLIMRAFIAIVSKRPKFLKDMTLISIFMRGIKRKVTPESKKMSTPA